VFHDSRTDRVLKLTNNRQFGSGIYLSNYLRNIRLSNLLFADDIRIEGVVKASVPIVVTSQPFVAGRNGTELEIDGFFLDLGFEKRGASRYASEELNLSVTDARGANVKVTPSGVLVPIDVQFALLREPGDDEL